MPHTAPARVRQCALTRQLARDKQVRDVAPELIIWVFWCLGGGRESQCADSLRSTVMACEGTYPVWQVTVDVAFHPLCLPVEYKYVVCSVRGGLPEQVEVVKWETDICNRIAFLPLARAQVKAPLIVAEWS